MIAFTILLILGLLIVLAVPALAMTRNGGYDNVSFICLGFLGIFAMTIILVGSTLFI